MELSSSTTRLLPAQQDLLYYTAETRQTVNTERTFSIGSQSSHRNKAGHDCVGNHSLPYCIGSQWRLCGIVYSPGVLLLALNERTAYSEQISAVKQNVSCTRPLSEITAQRIADAFGTVEARFENSNQEIAILSYFASCTPSAFTFLDH